MTSDGTGAAPAFRGRSIVGLLFTTFGVQGLGLLTGIIVARALGVEGRGELAAIILWPSVIAYLGDFGIPLGYVYESARDRAQAPALIGNAFFLSAIQWVFLSAIGSAVVAIALQRLGTEVVITAIAFLIAYLPLNLLGRYLNGIHRGIGAYAQFNAVRVSVPISYALGLGILAATGLLSIQWVIAATLVSNVSGLLLAVLLLHRKKLLTGPRKVDRELLRRTSSYGLRAHLGNLTPVDSMQVDLLLVTALLGASDAGLYSVAISAAMVIRAQGTAMGLIALPEVAAATTTTEQGKRTGSIFRFSLLLNALTAGAIIAAAAVLIPAIYGQGFTDSVSIVRILALGMVAASLRQVLGDCLRGAGSPLSGTGAELASWAVVVPALAFLMPLYGVTGAAIAVSLSYGAALGVAVHFARQLNLSVRDLFVPGPSDLTFAAGIARDLVSAVKPAPSGVSS